MPTELPDESVAKISAAVFAGRKIEAIKLYRQATGIGLKESKDFIEALESRLRKESPEKFTAPPSTTGCARTAAVMIVAIYTIYLVVRSLHG